MKPLFSLILIICLAVLISCNSDSSTNPDDNNNNGDNIASGIIGPTGGTITSDNVSIDIPANAFSTSAQVEISSLTTSPFEAERLSGSFKIEGIPSDYTKPIKILLRKSGSGSGTPYIAVGSETFSKSLNTESTAYKMFEARDSSGFLIVDLPVRNASLMKISGNEVLSGNITLQVEAVSATQTLSTSSHFKILHATNYATQASALAGYLEEAYTKYKSMGFVYEVTDPIEVNIINLGSEYYGKYSYNLWSDWLEFNSQKINNSAELRTTAGHEFFHWIQIRYDNRMWATKVLSNGDRYWFEEASAVWAEEKFSASSNYCSDARSSFELQPFYGIQSGASNDPEGHGYGMSAFVKYIADKYGDSIVKTIFDKLKIGLKPLDAIHIAVPDPVDYWLPDFLVSYAKGEVYSDISTALMVSDTRTSTWEITSLSDTLKTFSFTSSDLSGKLFNIKLNCDLWLETTQLSLTLTGADYLSLHLFSYKGSDITYLGTADEPAIVPTLKAVKEAGYHIMAMVANSQIMTPFTNTTSATLELKVNQPIFDFTICKRAYVNVYVNLNTYDPNWDASTWAMQTFSIGNTTLNSAEGTWTGNTFRADLSAPQEGYISITVNPETAEVLSYHVSYFSYPTNITLAGHNIPYGYVIYSGTTFEPIGFVNEVTGTETCDHLTTVDYHLSYSAPYEMLNITTLGYDCTTNAHVTVGFFWDNLNWDKME
ncbi:MAG: hypothetical protein KKA84_02495 [Bacteroidetes bacterium]|nr:hypothetical protein [Bacteroidota bacterium]